MIVGGGTVDLKNYIANYKKSTKKMNRYVYLRNHFREEKQLEVQTPEEFVEIVEEHNEASENGDKAKLEKRLKQQQLLEKRLQNQLQRVQEKIMEIKSQL